VCTYACCSAARLKSAIICCAVWLYSASSDDVLSFSSLSSSILCATTSSSCAFIALAYFDAALLYIYIFNYRSLLQKSPMKETIFYILHYSIQQALKKCSVVFCLFVYGMATISRLLIIIGLFCKRALQKRLYFAEETCNFKEPTHQSHPIAGFSAQRLLIPVRLVRAHSFFLIYFPSFLPFGS